MDTSEAARQLGRKGGDATKARHPEQFSKMGKKLKGKRPKEYYAEIGRKGALARAAKRKAAKSS